MFKSKANVDAFIFDSKRIQVFIYIRWRGMEKIVCIKLGCTRPSVDLAVRQIDTIVIQNKIDEIVYFKVNHRSGMPIVCVATLTSRWWWMRASNKLTNTYKLQKIDKMCFGFLFAFWSRAENNLNSISMWWRVSRWKPFRGYSQQTNAWNANRLHNAFQTDFICLLTCFWFLCLFRVFFVFTTNSMMRHN